LSKKGEKGGKDMALEKSSLREEARKAKIRMKSGFWAQTDAERERKIEKAREHGLNESKAGRYFAAQVSAQIEGKKEDEFYLQVKKILLSEGEVSNAIGRLTDQELYATLSYEEKQRYTLALSEKYLRALERFRAECEFDALHNDA
jgi:hypothetical protein